MADNHARSRRRALRVAVGALCTEVGYGATEESALETLTEMLQNLLLDIGRRSRSYSELSGRTEVMVTDVFMALVDLGINIDSIPAHARRQNKSVFIPPGQSTPQQPSKTLPVGDKPEHPSYIPDHLPNFPDPHSYIRTETHKQPVTEYQIIREKAASQRRDVENGLTRFIAKTGDRESLFKKDVSAFPLIAVQQHPLPYLNALLPKDQDLDSQQEPSDVQEAIARRLHANQEVQTVPLRSDISQTSLESSADLTDPDAIDNPYVRPVKMPRFKKRIIYR